MINQRNISSEKLLFGQWLISTNRVSLPVLKAALKTQNHEISEVLKSSPRLLGQILYEDFRSFRNRLELNKALVAFANYRKDLFHPKSPSFPPSASSSGNIQGRLPEHKQDKKRKTQHAPPARALFGQFLIEKGKITPVILEKALEIQNNEIKYQMRSSHRLLGEILANDFQVFSNRVELNRLLIDFNKFKSNLENQRTDLMVLNQDREEEV